MEMLLIHFLLLKPTHPLLFSPSPRWRDFQQKYGNRRSLCSCPISSFLPFLASFLLLAPLLGEERLGEVRSCRRQFPPFRQLLSREQVARNNNCLSIFKRSHLFNAKTHKRWGHLSVTVYYISAKR
ncbi:unknown protein [Desulfotalea psychrophila LSv54]|uniref:Uncharacterized protein n=1 Tax=Desulfotalea psychrophila (strain LSv54 / DSM 12343) TaxID=177439 RepID=Q6ANL1_DESPS|nr:unknown protein [Desulfotalea psychrophila LSv54]